MIMDLNNQVSSAQVVTVSAASTDYFDTLSNIRLGVSDLFFEFAVNTTAGTAPTLTIAIQGSTDAAFTTPITLASVTAGVATGTQILVPIDCSPNRALRYYRAYYTAGGTTPSFTITGGVVIDPQVDYQSP